MAGIPADVAEMIALFEQSDLVELSMQQGERRLLLRKGERAGVELQREAEAEPGPPLVVAIKAHMVGLFYWSKDKSGKPGVGLQQRVDKGQVVGFIEAMDIMNEVEAGHAGSVVEVSVGNGQPVEYGQVLIVLQPD